MKKLVSLAVSAVSAFTLLASFSTSAASTPSYCPKMYFKASKADGIHPQSNRRVYINSKDINGKADISFNIGSYVSDTKKQLFYMIALWDSTDKSIKLSGLKDPQSGDNKRAYNSIPGIISYDDSNFMSVTYSSGLSVKPFTLNGEKSDSYPFAVFNATIPSDIPIGIHPIKFYTSDEPFVSSEKTMMSRLSLNDGSDKSLSPNPAQKDAEPLNIAVSDRILGDIDGDGVYRADDASSILRAYTLVSSNKPSGLSEAQMIAADVDGDGYISASDASYVLNYFTYLSSFGKKDIYEYFGY